MIVFNGKKLPSWVTVTSINYDYVTIDSMELEAKRRVGNFDSGIDRGGLSINLGLFINPSNRLNIHEQVYQLKEFIMGDNWEVSKLFFLEDPEKYFNARVVGDLNMTDLFTHGETEITFLMSDPKKYDVYPRITSIPESGIKIHYSGLESTPVKITVLFDKTIENPSIKHKESASEVALKGKFSIGDELVIDTGARTVLLNDTSIKNKMKFKSNWFNMDRADNTLEGINDEGIRFGFKIEYRKAD